MVNIPGSITGLTGDKTVPDAVAEPIIAATSTFRAKKGVLVVALLANADIVYLGKDATVTTADGYPLYPGEAVFLEINNPANIYVIAGVAGLHVRGVVV